MYLSRILDKLKGNSSLRNGALFSIFSFINKGFSFLLLMILAGYIAPAEYGYLSLFGTVVMVISFIMAMSTEGYLSIAYFEDRHKGIKNAFSCILCTALIVSGFLAVVLLIGGKSLSQVLDLPQSVLFLAVLISFFTVFTNVNLDYFRLKERVGIYGIFSCTNALLNFVLTIALIRFFSTGWQGRVYAQSICFAIFGIIGLSIFFRGKYVSKPDPVYWKKLLLWGVPLIPHLATQFLRQGCDRYIINYYHSIEAVGLFSFALNMSNIISMIGMGFNQSNSVDIFKILSNDAITAEEKKSKLNSQERMIKLIYIICSVVVAVGTIVFIPIALPKYSECVVYIPLLSLCALFHCFYYLHTNYLFYFKKTKTLMYTTLGCSVLHLLLSLFLTRYSLLVTCGIYCVSQFAILYIVKRQALKLKRTYLN